MDTEQILRTLELYETRLKDTGVQAVAMNPSRTFGSLSQPEILAHAHYLIQGAKEMAQQAEKWGKVNRHLASIQMCLSFANWYTLEELKGHNR